MMDVYLIMKFLKIRFDPPIKYIRIHFEAPGDLRVEICQKCND